MEEEEADCRRSGGIESEEDGEVGGGVDRWECGGTRGRKRKHRPPVVPIQVTGDMKDQHDRKGRRDGPVKFAKIDVLGSEKVS